jgi:hypothetical protein
LGAQHSSHEIQGSTLQLPVLVDGSKTPTQIPDTLAYRHFLTTVAEPQNPSLDAVRRRDARIAPIALSAEDQEAFVNALALVWEQLEAIATSRNSIVSDTTLTDIGRSDRLAALKVQEDAIFTAATSRLRQALSSDGQNRLNKYIQDRVKVHIVIYGLRH